MLQNDLAVGTQKGAKDKDEELCPSTFSLLYLKHPSKHLEPCTIYIQCFMMWKFADGEREGGSEYAAMRRSGR